MKSFVIGVVTTVAALVLGALLYLRLGYLNVHADIQPSALESKLAMTFLSASTRHHARSQMNPVAPTGENLFAGMKLYRQNCAICHRAPTPSDLSLGLHFYPPAPQFTHEPADMPESQNFYIIKHGIRWTAMPAWGRTLNDIQIWQLVTFLKHMRDLPPSLDRLWRQTVTFERSPGAGSAFEGHQRSQQTHSVAAGSEQ